ncbi:MAG: pectate lyase [Asticcacaulis sp.]
MTLLLNRRHMFLGATALLPVPALAHMGARPDPVAEAWTAYAERSSAAKALMLAQLTQERAGLAGLPLPPEDGNGLRTMPLNQPAEWYRSEAGRQVTRNILSFQLPVGGWGKNQPRDKAPRQRGQSFVPDSGFAKDPRPERMGSYVGTFDNGATIHELFFLGQVISHDDVMAEVALAALRKGLNYIATSQYPNGGWPQVWPLQGGYHDAVTLNDNMMVNILRLLRAVAHGEGAFSALTDSERGLARAQYDKGVQLLLRLQTQPDLGAPLWAQQYDARSLKPVAARAFEPVALSSTESADVLTLLRDAAKEGAALAKAYEAGKAALARLALFGVDWVRTPEDGMKLVPVSGAGPIWSRYYTLGTLKPVFGDRDGRIYDDVNVISLERRNGYAWFSKAPAKVTGPLRPAAG